MAYRALDNPITTINQGERIALLRLLRLLHGCAAVALLKSTQRQFAPACGRFTNTAKDGPTQTPGLVECDAGFFCLGGLLGNEIVNIG
jgi:hypothetical protein